jgi:hypothetical protein
MESIQGDGLPSSLIGSSFARLDMLQSYRGQVSTVQRQIAPVKGILGDDWG